MIMSWEQFDRILLESEWMIKKNRLTPEFAQVLKENNCWKNGEPYCTYRYFTETIDPKSIRNIYLAFKNMKRRK
jgi:hypothetical protein